MNNIPILTLPIKPSSYKKTGMFLSPLFAYFLAKKLNGTDTTFLNLLDTYKNQIDYIPQFIDTCQRLGIITNSSFSDLQMKSQLFDKVDILASKGYIYSDKREIITCSCGKVDCLKESLYSRTGKTNYTCFDIPTCKLCQEKCKIIEKDVLLLKPSALDIDKYFFFPTYSTKDFVELNAIFNNREILISKQRNTNIYYKFGQNTYNLDVDFFWANYASLWPNKQKIILGSQRSIYPLFFVNALQKLHNPENETFTILLPYIQNKHSIDINKELESLDNDKTRAMYLLYSIKFKDKISNWDSNALNSIKKLTSVEIDNIYQELISPILHQDGTSFRQSVINSINQLNIRNIIQINHKSNKRFQVPLSLLKNGNFHQSEM